MTKSDALEERNKNSSSQDSTDNDSACLNELDRTADKAEVESIALLRQIFSDEEFSTEELKRLHQERISRRRKSRSYNNSHIHRNGSLPHGSQVLLPNDFLRLPPNLAVRRYDEETDRWRYELVAQLEKQALKQFERHYSFQGREYLYFTKVVFRDSKVGLGLTLFEEHALVRVHSLISRDGRQWLDSKQGNDDASGPAARAGIQPGDLLIGINGTALMESASPEDSLLGHAVSTIRLSPDPIVLHLQRMPNDPAAHTPPQVVSLYYHTTPSLLDDTLLDSTIDESPSVEISFQSELSSHSTPMLDKTAEGTNIHNFVTCLTSRGLINSLQEQQLNSRMLAQFTERTRQWEATSSFHIQSDVANSETFIPLMGVRKALCIRIVNTFLDGNLTAYTIWCYDVESGIEWFAPIRYFRDFQDLRAASLPLYSCVAQIPFPKQTLSIFASPVRAETENEREVKCRQLEHFVRSLCGMIYREKLHPGAAELAVHVQSFLGCDMALNSVNLSIAADQKDRQSQQNRIRLLLKRSIQRYTYRLFLLDIMCEMVDNFVDTVRTRGPRLQDIEALEAQGRTILKTRAMKDLEQIQTFLDYLQDLVLDSCMEDFRSMAEREDYEAIHGLIRGKKGEVYWDRLVREAVREQIEIEVYVPLRGVVSRWIVNGWRHEDMEVSFKLKMLRQRPQSFFRIPKTKMSPSDWLSVSNILKEGVGQSTLPCAKLRAIVDAAREVTRVFGFEHGISEHPIQDGKKASDDRHLGADDFLPIFIFCVVQAEMERPCALCVLLRTLCDRINRIGEIGYYLASFEAAITHIQEVDLTQDPEEMLSFLSIPLSDS